STGAFELFLAGGSTTNIQAVATPTLWYDGGGSSTSAVVTLGGGGSAPAIAAQSTSGTAGTAFNYQVVATGATSFSSPSLPASGFTINSSGVISNTSPVAGTTVANVTATNANGSNSANVTITIAAAGSPPTMANQTTSGTQNQALSYQVVASGATSFVVLAGPALPPNLQM